MANSQNFKRKTLHIADQSIDEGICHLCGYKGQTRLLSIEKTGYHFLLSLPPASGALPVTDHTTDVHACHLCFLILEKQKELNQESESFFFKGFFRWTNNKVSSNRLNNNQSHPIQDQIKPINNRTKPHHRKSSILRANDDIAPFDSSSLLISTPKTTIFESCQLCQSIKMRGTLYKISKVNFNFLSSNESSVCTLCYYNLCDQSKEKVKQFRRPHPRCYLCQSSVKFRGWEVKLLEVEYFPFLLRLHNENYREKYLYNDRNLALSCDSCFYSLLFQFIDQERRNTDVDQRSYTWQCNSSLIIDDKDKFYSSSNN